MRRRLVPLAVVVLAVAIVAASWSLRQYRTQRTAAPPTAPPSPGATASKTVLTGTVTSHGAPVFGAEVTVTGTRPIDPSLPSHCEAACGLPLWSNECPEAPAQLIAVAASLSPQAIVLARTSTAADGTFRLEPSGPGPLTVWASQADAGVAVAGDVSAGAPVQLSLQAEPPLFGRVLDDERHPVAEARVAAISAEHARSFEVLTDQSGQFRFAALPGDDWAVVASHVGLMPTHEVATARADRGLTLVLPSPRRLAGQVVFAGKPVPGAPVGLSGMHRVTRTTADPTGQFTFEGLRPGTYLLEVTDDERTGTLEAPLYPGLDSTELVLELHAAVTVAGTVRNSDHHPVASAQVTLTPDDGEPGPPVTTGADGAFEIRGVSPGALLVTAGAPGYQPATPMAAQAVAGRRTQLELTLRRAALVSGVVTDDRGAPVANAEVIATTAETLAPASSTHTSDAGTFTLDQLTSASYELSVEHERHVASRTTVRAPASNVHLTVSRGATITGSVIDDRGAPQPDTQVSAICTSPGESFERETVTGPDGRFSLYGLFEADWVVGATKGGRAAAARVPLTNTSLAQVALRFGRGESIRGRVADQHGLPVADATVTAESTALQGQRIPGKRELRDTPLDELLKVLSRGETLSHADGTFEVPDLLPGTYVLTASKEGFSPDTLGQPCRPGAHDARLVLRALSSITGRVVDAGGKPISGFEIDHQPRPSPTGQFSVPLPGLGVQTLLFSAPGFASTERKVTIDSKADQSMGDVVLTRGHRVEVWVLDAVSRAPVAGAVVRSSLLAAEAATGPDGRATLARVDEGPVELLVKRPGYQSRTIVAGPRDLRLDIELDPGASVSGTVSGAGPQARVTAADQTTQLSAPIAPDGHYALGGLAPGTWVIEPWGPASRPFQAQRVDIHDREQLRLDFAPRPKGATLTVMLVEPGEPAGFLDWGLVPAASRVPTNQRELGVAMQLGLKPRAMRGDEVVEAVPPGSYRLLVFRGHGHQATLFQQPIEVTGDATIEVRLPTDSPLLPVQ